MVTHISDIICARKELGLTLTVETDEVSPALMEEIGLTEAKLAEVNENIEEELSVVKALIE